jgi:hypothetical protein
MMTNVHPIVKRIQAIENAKTREERAVACKKLRHYLAENVGCNPELVKHALAILNLMEVK